MNPSSTNQNVSVIVAYRISRGHLLDVFADLRLWFNDITIVGPACYEISEQIKSLGGKWLEAESSSIQDLWDRGIQSVDSEWCLLLEGSEYISTILKESIVETSNSKPNRSTWFPIKREIFLLKQHLKYPLEWTYDPKPGLLFNDTGKFNKIDLLAHVEEKPLKGKSVYFAESTVAEVISNCMPRADQAAACLYRINPNLSLFKLALKALAAIPLNFFKKWILVRGIREGFEGLVFSGLDTVTVVLGYIGYYEKYIRSGRQIEDNLDSVKNILIVKLRGLGDAVLATPVLKNLKTLMPNVTISVLTFDFCKALFENNPNLAEIYGLSGDPSPNEIKKITKTLSGKHFDLIINLHSRNFSSQLVKKIKSSWSISRSYFIREKYRDVLIGSDHELDKTSIERDLDCLRVLGLDPVDKEPELFLTEDETLWARKHLIELGVDPLKKLIIIHPTVSQSIRNWGFDRFVVLSQKLITNYGCQVMGIFSSKEKAIADSLTEQVKEAFVYVGPIRPSIALINEADLMVDNSSGPAQISVALKIPTLVLVGPDYQNTYHEKSTYKKNHYVFFQDVPCRDLFFTKCLTPKTCEKLICLEHPVDEVVKKSLELLDKSC